MARLHSLDRLNPGRKLRGSDRRAPSAHCYYGRDDCDTYSERHSTGPKLSRHPSKDLRRPRKLALMNLDRIPVIRKMTPDKWLRLVKLINESMRADQSLTGVVITHGTDTMEEIFAYFSGSYPWRSQGSRTGGLDALIGRSLGRRTRESP